MNSPRKLVIIGSGPAGLTAAIYAARGGIRPLVISGREAGGQLTLTTDVDDFPGFPEGIQGPDLMSNIRKQAERFDAEFINEDVISVDFGQRPLFIQTETQKIQTQAVIIATGASAMWLNLPSEQRLRGKGVSACAVCDGFFFRDKDVLVVGGGDTAMRETLYLSKICKSVTVIHRRGTFRAQVALLNSVKAKANVKILLNSVLDEVLGENNVIGVNIKNTQNGKLSFIEVAGVFVAIGHRPNTGFLGTQLKLDARGYLVVHGLTKTSVDGIFAAGDVSDHRYRQGVTAAGAGCMAALDVEDYLEQNPQ